MRLLLLISLMFISFGYLFGQKNPKVASASVHFELQELTKAKEDIDAVFDKKMFGPDSKSSLDMKQIKNLVEGVTQIKTSLISPYTKKISKSRETLKILFGKSLCVNKDLKKGDIITFSDLETKKPKGYGILASEYEKILGKKLNKDLNQWSFLNDKDLVK